MATARATLTVKNVWCTVESDAKAFKLIDNALKVWTPGAERTWLYRSHKWDGYDHTFSTALGRFRSGILNEVVALLKDEGYEVVIDNKRKRPQYTLHPFNLRELDDWEHQQAAIDTCIAAGRGTVQHATGTGKCLTPEARVLTSGLRWVAVGSLQVGDNLVGFDEDHHELQPTVTNSKGRWPRRLQASVVTGTGRELLPCYRITLASGTTLTCTDEHKWLVQDTRSTNKVRWLTTAWLYRQTKKQPHSPYRFARYFTPWTTDETCDGGYLRGLLDGEGSIGKRKGDFHGVSFAQKNPIVLGEARRTFSEYQYRERIASKGVTDFDFATYEGMRLLGRTQPQRLLANWKACRWPRLSRQEWDEVVSIEPVGKQEVVTLQTSTKTFIAEGFGSHNTDTFIGLTQVLGVRTLILSNQKSITIQTTKRFAHRLHVPEKQIGLWGDGKHRDGHIVCATFQTLSSALKGQHEDDVRKWLKTFDMIIVDEGHHLVAETYQEVFDACPAFFRFAFSATPFKSKGKDKRARLHVIGSCGDIIHQFGAGAAVKAGIITRAEVVMFQWHDDDPNWNWDAEEYVIDDDQYEWSGRRKGKRKPEKGLYAIAVVENKERNAAVVDAVAIMVEDKRSTLLLVRQARHGQELFHLIREELERDDVVGYAHGGTSQDERERLFNALGDGRLPVLICTTIADEGINIPGIDALVLAGAGKADHKVIQQLGRGQRKKEGKSYLQVVDFMDTHSATMWRHAKARLAAYESDERAYKVKVVKA
jgi:superfamily II DNA or RNA helicase